MCRKSQEINPRSAVLVSDERDNGIDMMALHVEMRKHAKSNAYFASWDEMDKYSAMEWRFFFSRTILENFFFDCHWIPRPQLRTTSTRLKSKSNNLSLHFLWFLAYHFFQRCSKVKWACVWWWRSRWWEWSCVAWWRKRWRWKWCAGVWTWKTPMSKQYVKS